MRHERSFTVFDPIPAPPYILPEEAPSDEVIFGLLQRHTKAELLRAIEEVSPRKKSHSGGKTGRPKIDNDALMGPLLTLASLVWYGSSSHTRNLSCVSGRLAKLSLGYVLTSWNHDQNCLISTEGELHNAEGIRRKLTGYIMKNEISELEDTLEILSYGPSTIISSLSDDLNVEPMNRPENEVEIWRIRRWQSEEMSKKLKSSGYPYRLGPVRLHLPTTEYGLLEFDLNLSKSSDHEMLARGLREIFKVSVGQEWADVIASWRP